VEIIPLHMGSAQNLPWDALPWIDGSRIHHHPMGIQTVSEHLDALGICIVLECIRLLLSTIFTNLRPQLPTIALQTAPIFWGAAKDSANFTCHFAYWQHPTLLAEIFESAVRRFAVWACAHCLPGRRSRIAASLRNSGSLWKSLLDLYNRHRHLDMVVCSNFGGLKLAVKPPMFVIFLGPF